MSLPQRFTNWFAARGWHPREHQLAVLEHAEKRESVLLISPTGGGKTLAGFLPSLIEITARPGKTEGSMDDPELVAHGRVYAGEAWHLIHKRRVDDKWYDDLHE